MFRGVSESAWSRRHIRRHGVTADEVRQAVLEGPYWITRGREDSYLIYGRTHAGRLLMIVALMDDGDAFIVTARDMTDREKRTYRRKAR